MWTDKRGLGLGYRKNQGTVVHLSAGFHNSARVNGLARILKPESVRQFLEDCGAPAGMRTVENRGGDRVPRGTSDRIRLQESLQRLG
jgi:hypothetical protein